MIEILKSLKPKKSEFQFDFATFLCCFLLLLNPTTVAICEFFIFLALFVTCSLIDYKMNQDKVSSSDWVNGEIVDLKINEIAKGTIYCQELNIRLKRGEIFQNPCQGRELHTERVYKFLVEETVHEEIKKSKKSTRYFEIYTKIFRKIIIAVLLLSMILNVFKITNVDKSYENFIRFLARYQIYTIIPLLNIQIPFINLVTKAYCNAYILTLFDALQQSKTEFEDDDDVDEFDAAPAPIKEFRLSWRSIVNKIANGFKGMKRLGLVEDLASCTVLCSVDKMGSIARPIPAVDQVLLVEVCLFYDTQHSLPTQSNL